MQASAPFFPQRDSPMIIVTCAARGERSGCLVGFATQCSIEPPRFLVCLSVANHTYSVALSASSLAIHVLAESDFDLAERFGEVTGDNADKFAGLEVHDGVSGAPILDRCAAVFEGRIWDRFPVGDHVAFVVEPLGEVDVNEELHESQLQLRDVSGLLAGHPISET